MKIRLMFVGFFCLDYVGVDENSGVPGVDSLLQEDERGGQGEIPEGEGDLREAHRAAPPCGQGGGRVKGWGGVWKGGWGVVIKSVVE